MHSIKINNFEISNTKPFTLIAGPCVIENREHAIKMAKFIYEICKTININFIYKSSFDKANRTSINSSRGISLEEAIDIFKEIKENLGCPILTDVHNEEQCKQLSTNECC